MKYTSHLKQLSVDMSRSSFDELDKNNRWVELGDLYHKAQKSPSDFLPLDLRSIFVPIG